MSYSELLLHKIESVNYGHVNIISGTSTSTLTSFHSSERSESLTICRVNYYLKVHQDLRLHVDLQSSAMTHILHNIKLLILYLYSAPASSYLPPNRLTNHIQDSAPLPWHLQTSNSSPPFAMTLCSRLSPQTLKPGTARPSPHPHFTCSRITETACSKQRSTLAGAKPLI